MKGKIASLIDTSICDYNLGNQIIMDSINSIMSSTFNDYFLIRLAHLESYGRLSRNYMNISDFTLFGGTNALSSHLFRYNQTGFSFIDSFRISNVLLLGVGWWSYQSKPDKLTSYFLKRILSSKYIHSVRDSYTLRLLQSIGIMNVINTCCPTTWGLSQDFCSTIRQSKSNTLLVTLTDYRKSSKIDIKILNKISNFYSLIYFWPQGIGDIQYMESIKHYLHFCPVLLSPSLLELNKILSSGNVDYIGTRLHAGIRS